MQTIPTLSMGAALKQAANKVLDWHGRSRRSEYWYTVLAVTIVLIVTYLVNQILYSACAFVLGLAMIPISLRRLHDIGRSGWWYGALIIANIVMGIAIIISVLGNAGNGTSLFVSLGIWLVVYMIANTVYYVVLLYFFCCDSKPEDNKYGKSPKYVEE